MIAGTLSLSSKHLAGFVLKPQSRGRKGPGAYGASRTKSSTVERAATYHDQHDK